MLNQAVRRCGLLVSPELATAAAGQPRFTHFTPTVAAQLAALAGWNWSSVTPKAMRVSLGFLCIIVGLQKVLTFFFGWFIKVVAFTPPVATIAAFMGTGVVRRSAQAARTWPLH